MSRSERDDIAASWALELQEVCEVLAPALGDLGGACDTASGFARRAATRLTGERAAIVAFLRSQANAPHPIEAGEYALSAHGRGLLLHLASRIQAGDHNAQ